MGIIKNCLKRVIKGILKIFVPLHLRKKIRSILNMPDQLNVLSNLSQQINDVKQQNNAMSYELQKIKTLLLLKNQSPELLRKFASGLTNDEKLINALSGSYIFPDIQNEFRINAGIFNQAFFGHGCVPINIVKENLINMTKNPITKADAFYFLTTILMARYQVEDIACLHEIYDVSFLEFNPWVVLPYIKILILNKEEKKALNILIEYLNRYDLESIVEHLPIADLAHRSGFTNENIEAASGLFQTIMKNVETGLLEQYIKKHGTLAIVCNGPQELGLQRGKEIDAHDIVVRINYCDDSENYINDYGSKTNIIVHIAAGLDFNKICKRKTDIFVSHSLFCETFNRTIIQKYKETHFTNMTTFEFSSLMPDIQDKYNISWPSSGFRAIYYFKKILNLDIRKTDIYGNALSAGRVMDGHYENKNIFFERTGGDRRKYLYHDFDKEFEALKNMFDIK